MLFCFSSVQFSCHWKFMKSSNYWTLWCNLSEPLQEQKAPAGSQNKTLSTLIFLNWAWVLASFFQNFCCIFSCHIVWLLWTLLFSLPFMPFLSFCYFLLSPSQLLLPVFLWLQFVSLSLTWKCCYVPHQQSWLLPWMFHWYLFVGVDMCSHRSD